MVECGLTFKVKFRGPPGCGPVFQLRPEGVKAVSATLRTDGGEVLDVQISGLFKIVVVGDNVGALLGVTRRRQDKRN